MIVLQRIKESLTKDKERLSQAQQAEANQQRVEDVRRLKKEKKHSSRGRSLKQEKQQAAQVQSSSQNIQATDVAVVDVSSRVPAGSEQRTLDGDKSTANNNGTIISVQNGRSTMKTLTAIMSAPSLPVNIQLPLPNHSVLETSLQAPPHIIPPNILAPELLLSVAGHIVNKTTTNTLAVANDAAIKTDVPLINGEHFFVRAATACRFFRNFRDVFFSNKNRNEKDGFSKSVYAKAEAQFKKIRDQFIIVTPDRRVIYKPLDAVNKEKFVSLLMQIKWAASIANDPAVRHQLYCEYYENYHILKKNLGFRFDESKEMQLYIDGLAVEIHYLNNSIDKNELFFATTSMMRTAILNKYEKTYDDLNDDENKRAFIVEVLNIIDQFKLDAILDSVAKKIQFLKVIYKDVPAPSQKNGEKGRLQVEIAVDEVVDRLKKMKEDSTREKSVQQLSSENEVDFNALIDEAIKRVYYLNKIRVCNVI